MQIFLVLILFMSSPAFAEISLDVDNLENILDLHPEDIETRLLLASYYLKKDNLTRSDQLIKIALTQENNNKIALNLKHKWLIASRYTQFLKQQNITDITNSKVVDDAITTLYQEKKDALLSQFFHLLEDKKIPLNKNNQIIHASLLFKQKKYKNALDVLMLIPSQSDKKTQRLLANTCYALKKMGCAIDPLHRLFNASPKDLKLGLQLSDALIHQGRIIDAQSISNIINKKHATHPKAINLSKRITSLFATRVATSKKSYQESTSEKNVKNLAESLLNKGDKKAAYSELHQFIKKHPKNDDIKVFTAQRYALNQQYNLAIKLLQTISKKTPKSQLLLAKYIAWSSKQTERVQTILNNLLTQKNTTDHTIINDATLLLGNTYLWQGNKSKAKEILKPLAQQEPSNSVIQEAYLMANNEFNPLIKKYEHQLKKEPKNKKVILRLANLYEAAKLNTKALNYYERYRKLKPTEIKLDKTMGLLYLTQKKYDLGFKYLKRDAYRQHTEESLLSLANNYHWNGFNFEALEVISKLQAYYPHSKKAITLKTRVSKAPLNSRNKKLILANKEYKNNNFKQSIPFFKQYLIRYPSDLYTRFRYAYALGQSGSYTKATKEFSKLVATTPNNLKTQYHYAYSLERSDNTQLAKEIYSSIVEKISSAKAAPDDQIKLSELADVRLAAIEKNKDIVINGIYLGGGGRKVLEPESMVFSNAFVAPAQMSKNKAHASFVAEDALYYSPRDSKHIALDYQHTSDKAGVNFNNPKITAQYNTWPYEVNFLGGGFTFEDNACEGEYGGSIELSGLYKKSTTRQYGGGLRIDELDGETKFSPFINTRLKFDTSNLDIQLYKRPLFYEKLSCSTLKNHYDRYGVQLSGNAEFTKKQALWFSLDAGYIDDDNVEVIPQFNLVVYHDKFDNKFVPMDYEVSLEGYYVWNKQQSNDYYSPEFFDSTSLSLRPIFQVNKNIDLISQAALGYSVDVNNIIFRYGLWAEYTLEKGLKAKAGCERSNVGSSNAGTQNYHSNNCLATLEYNWR